MESWRNDAFPMQVMRGLISIFKTEGSSQVEVEEVGRKKEERKRERAGGLTP